MKKALFFVIASLVVNVSAFAVGPTTVNCKEIADKVKAAKDAAKQAASQPDAANKDSKSAQ